MPDNSAILALPYIQPSQAQKHVTHNEAIATLDVLVQLSLVDFGSQTPPAVPLEGETHALGAAPTGVWAGQDDMLASFRDGLWVFIAPLTGWRAWGQTPGELRVWTGSAWALISAETDNLAGLGINTTADVTNRLSLRADATLLSHDGAGHQLKINKATAGDTASLLFQSGFTGHAEMGLSGDNDFAIKVSDDGSNWSEALSVDGASGNVVIGATANASAIVTIQTSGTGIGRLAFGNPGDADAGRIEYDHSVNGLSLWAGGAEALRVSGAGKVSIGSTSTSGKLFVEMSNNSTICNFGNTHASFSKSALNLNVGRAASSAYRMADFWSGNYGDLEFRFSGDGNGSCDGSWTGGGADYAEYFEWADGNPDATDRRGISVVLEGDKIREAAPGETPIGVISGNPSVIGDGDMDRWKGKYLRDDFGTYIFEDYQAVEWTEAGSDVTHSYAADAIPGDLVVPADATSTRQSRRVLNPDYDPGHAYTPRAERPEWDAVGLMGKLRLRKGQATGPAWIKMRDVSARIEEWLVR